MEQDNPDIAWHNDEQCHDVSQVEKATTSVANYCGVILLVSISDDI